MTQAQAIRNVRGLALEATIVRLTKGLEVELRRGVTQRTLAIGKAARTVLKIALRHNRSRDYAQAHNRMLEWVHSLPQYGEGQLLPEDAARAQFPPRGPVNLFHVFAGLVGILQQAGFTYRECADLLDDGWGGSDEQRTRRAKQQAARARPDPRRFLDAAMCDVKGDCVVCRAAAIALADSRPMAEDLPRDEERDDSGGSVAGGGGRARDARTSDDSAVVDPHGQTAGVSTWPTPGGSAERSRSAAVREAEPVNEFETPDA